MTVLRKPSGMTTAEFRHWTPETKADHRWQLVDGIPVCMAPASTNHARIQAEAGFLLTAHLRLHRPGCDVLVAPGVVPRIWPDSNHRIPDLGVTCAPPSDSLIMTEPVLLIEILSPSNQAITRSNMWAYTTIPEVAEILLLSSLRIEAELLRRGSDGEWPAAPVLLGDGDTLALASIGFSAPLRDVYETTSLVG